MIQYIDEMALSDLSPPARGIMLEIGFALGRYEDGSRLG